MFYPYRLQSLYKSTYQCRYMRLKLSTRLPSFYHDHSTSCSYKPALIRKQEVYMHSHGSCSTRKFLGPLMLYDHRSCIITELVVPKKLWGIDEVWKLHTHGSCSTREALGPSSCMTIEVVVLRKLWALQVV